METQGVSISEILNLPETIDLLNDDDFESTMMMFDNVATPRTASFRRESISAMDMNLGLVDLFSPNETDSAVVASRIKEEKPALIISTSAFSNAATMYNSPEVKLRNIRPSLLGHGTPDTVTIKQEPGAPELSPVMDSFLQESWDDIVEGSSKKSSRSLTKVLHGGLPITGPTSTSTPTIRIAPLSPHYFVPNPLTSHIPSKPIVVALVPPPKHSITKPAEEAKQSKPPRRAKQCVAEGCTRRAQSNNRCKTHGGGARCQMEGCTKSSQGGGLCRAHGGGKKCRVPGCTKGTQRLGLCYLHGGIRRCMAEGCKKKDRGNGYCISHGGGRRCEVMGCERSVRKGNHCQAHQCSTSDSPFKIRRSQVLISQ